MISIVKIQNGDSNEPAKPTAWILAADIHDARKQATDAGDRELAIKLFEAPDNLLPGSYEISEGIWVLVS